MDIMSIEKGRTLKTVTVSGVKDVDDNEVVAFAMAAAGETRGSLYGWHVAYFRDGSLAVVDLNTD